MSLVDWVKRFGLALVLGLGMSGIALAITSNGFKYNSVQEGAYIIGPADLHPEDTDISYHLFLTELTAFLNPGESVCFSAPIHLPQGAKVIQATNYLRSGIYGDPTIKIYSAELAGNPLTTMLTVLHQDNSGTTIGNTTVFPFGDVVNTVNNRRRFYFYQVCMAKDDFFVSAKIVYSYGNAGS